MQGERFEEFAALIGGIHGDIQKIKAGHTARLGLKSVHIFWLYLLRVHPEGLSAREIAEMLERAKKRVCLIARVDTLEYLMRGGRLSRTAAIAGTMLNIKPVIGLEDGEIKVFGKARGSRQSSNMLTEFIGKKGGIDFDMPLMLAYSGTDDALLKGYVDNSRPLWEGRADSLPVSVVGSTIGTHAGPGAIAVAFFSRNGN